MAVPDHEARNRRAADELLRWDEIPATRWTLVGRAGATDAQQRGALEELLRLYLPVLRGHLVSTLRVSSDRADDLLQGFLADRVVERNIIRQADASRGRFRRFMLTALNRYVTDMYRRESAAKRRPAGGPPLSIDALAEQKAASPTATQRFDRLWANEVLAEVMRRTRSNCQAAGRMDAWTVLEARILQPVTTGVPPMPHGNLAQQMGLSSAAQAANLLVEGKQRFTDTFREVVAEYVVAQARPDVEAAEIERAVEEEIRELWTIFSSPPG